MTAKLKNILGWVLLVIGLALAWYGLASANDFVFEALYQPALITTHWPIYDGRWS
jgi:hypothetical protein